MCDICDKPVKGSIVYAVDKCKIPKKGGLDIEETIQVCPGCMKSDAEEIVSKFQ